MTQLKVETETDLPPASSLPKCPTARSGPGVQNLILSPLWAAGTQQLCHHLLPPRICISRKLELKVELGLKPRHPNSGCKCPSVLTSVPNTPASQETFNLNLFHLLALRTKLHVSVLFARDIPLHILNKLQKI